MAVCNKVSVDEVRSRRSSVIRSYMIYGSLSDSQRSNLFHFIISRHVHFDYAISLFLPRSSLPHFRKDASNFVSDAHGTNRPKTSRNCYVIIYMNTRM